MVSRKHDDRKGRESRFRLLQGVKCLEIRKIIVKTDDPWRPLRDDHRQFTDPPDEAKVDVLSDRMGSVFLYGHGDSDPQNFRYLHRAPRRTVILARWTEPS